MHAQEVLFSNKTYKKPVMFFKNDRKKIAFITKCNEKNCLKRITLEKKLSASHKNGNPLIKIMVRPLTLFLRGGEAFSTSRLVNCSELLNETSHHLETW